MKLTPRQEALYEAITDLDPKYVEQAASPKKSRPRATLKRLVAVAAMVAIIISCITFFGGKDSDLLFATTVHAADDIDTVFHINVTKVQEYEPNTGHIKDSLPREWLNKDLFCAEIFVSHTAERPFASLFVTVDYLNNTFSGDYTDEMLSITFPRDEQTGLLCRIYGWGESSDVYVMNFTVNILQNAEDGEQIQLCKQPFKAYIIDSNGDLCVNGNLELVGVEYTYSIMTTEELVNIIANDTKFHPLLLFSSPESVYDYIYSAYANILPVLSVREDAAEYMLAAEKTLRKQLPHNDPDGVKCMNALVLLNLLQSEPYVQHLSNEDIAYLRTFWDDISE